MRNEAKIAEYVRNQLQEDIMSDQISMKEYYDGLRVARRNRQKRLPLKRQPENVLRLTKHSVRLKTQVGNMPLKGLYIPRV